MCVATCTNATSAISVCLSDVDVGTISSFLLVLRKMGILHRAAGLLNKDNTSSSRFSVQFAEERGRMTPDERHYMSSVLPHVAIALPLVATSLPVKTAP